MKKKAVQRNVSVCIGYGETIKNQVEKLEKTTFEGIPETTRYTPRSQTGFSLKLKRCLDIYWHFDTLLKDIDDFGEERTTEYKLNKIVELYLKEREK